MSKFVTGALAGAAAVVSAVAPAAAQDASPDAALLMAQAARSDAIVVLGRRIPQSQADAAADLNNVPGGVDLVPFEAFENRLSVSFADTLRLSPGVIADPRFGEEVRLSVRGSGLSRGFHMRGMILRLDGVPVNLADGAGDFQEIDPLSAQRIEVYRGANGLRYGAASLGGAVNLATPTGRDVAAPLSARLELGSWETFRANLRGGAASDTADIAGSITYTDIEGFRDQLVTESTRVSLNSGVQWAAGETRFTLNLNEINQEIPGSLTRTQALTTPRIAAAANIAGDQARDIRSARGAVRHMFNLAGAEAEVGAWAFGKSLYHPIFQVVDHDSLDWGLFARVEDESETGALRRWTIGAAFTRGDNNARQFVNVNGQEGALAFAADQDAETAEIYGEAEIGLTDTLSGIVGAQAIRTERFYRRTFPTVLNADRSFEAFNPKLGFLLRPSEAITVYGNVSRSFEPPTFTELVQNNIVQPIRPQRAWTGEIGVRGESGPLLYDVALYRANVEDEMLQYNVDPSHPAATFNANDTIHAGLEAFVQWRIAQTEAGDLTLAAAYTYSDFRFDNDPQFGDNELAGGPRHQLHGELTWRANSGWFVTPNLNWIPEDVTVDYANTTRAPGYAVWGLSAGVDVGAARFFLDARNLTDENYIATFSTAVTATPASALYWPGEPRAVYGGVTVRFGAPS